MKQVYQPQRILHLLISIETTQIHIKTLHIYLVEFMGFYQKGAAARHNCDF